MNEYEWLTTNNAEMMVEWIRINNIHRRQNNVVDQFCFSDRKLRLFSCACCRQVWDLLTSKSTCITCLGVGQRTTWKEYTRRMKKTRTIDCPRCKGTGEINYSQLAVEVAERYADGLSSEAEITSAQNNIDHVFRGLGNPSKTWSTERKAWWRARSCLLGAQQSASESVRSELDGDPKIQADLLRDIFGNPYRPFCNCGGVGYFDIVRGENDHDQVDCTACTELGKWTTWNDSIVLKISQSIYDNRTFEEMPILADALEEAGCTNKDILNHCRDNTIHAKGCHVLDLILGMR